MDNSLEYDANIIDSFPRKTIFASAIWDYPLFVNMTERRLIDASTLSITDMIDWFYFRIKVVHAILYIYSIY